MSFSGALLSKLNPASVLMSCVAKFASNIPKFSPAIFALKRNALLTTLSSNFAADSANGTTLPSGFFNVKSPLSRHRPTCALIASCVSMVHSPEKLGLPCSVFGSRNKSAGKSLRLNCFNVPQLDN